LVKSLESIVKELSSELGPLIQKEDKRLDKAYTAALKDLEDDKYFSKPKLKQSEASILAKKFAKRMLEEMGIIGENESYIDTIFQAVTNIRWSDFVDKIKKKELGALTEAKQEMGKSYTTHLVSHKAEEKGIEDLFEDDVLDATKSQEIALYKKLFPGSDIKASKIKADPRKAFNKILLANINKYAGLRKDYVKS